MTLVYVIVLGERAGGNSDSVHVYNTADDNDSTLTAQAPNPTHARPTSHQIDRHQDRYNQLNLKGTKVPPSFASTSANDEYDHTEVRHERRTTAPAQTERSIPRRQQQQQGQHGSDPFLASNGEALCLYRSFCFSGSQIGNSLPFALRHSLLKL